MATKKTTNGKGSGRRRAPTQTDIPGARPINKKIEPRARELVQERATLAEDKKRVDQATRLTLAAMQAEGVDAYTCEDGNTLRLKTSVKIGVEKPKKPRKRMGDGKLATVEASR